jgi:transposase
VFRSGRDVAAWIGLVPRQDSTGWQAEARADLQRRILIVGATAVLRRAQENPGNIAG